MKIEVYLEDEEVLEALEQYLKEARTIESFSSFEWQITPDGEHIKVIIDGDE